MAAYSSPLYSPAGGYGTYSNGYQYTQSGWVPQFTPAGGSVLGAQAPTGSQQQTGQNTGNNQNIPMESAPSGPDFSEIDAAVNQGMDALNQLEGSVNSNYTNAVNEAVTGTNQNIAEAQAEENKRMGEYGTQRTEAKNATESAVAAARRQASEIQQGIQSRYGGTTGTGAFASEILGSQAMQNISANQQALQVTLGKITAAEDNVKNTTARLVQSLNENLKLAKDQARSALQQSLAEIASKRSELQTAKAKMRMDAIQSYQNTVSEINRRNTAFQQELYLKAQDAAEQLNSFKNTTIDKYQAVLENFQPSNFNVGDTPYAVVPTSSGGYTYLKGSTDTTYPWGSTDVTGGTNDYITPTNNVTSGNDLGAYLDSQFGGNVGY